MKRPEKQMGRQEGEDIIANKLNNTTGQQMLLSWCVVFLVFLPSFQMQEE